jgi:hypothetical protein
MSQAFDAAVLTASTPYREANVQRDPRTGHSERDHGQQQPEDQANNHEPSSEPRPDEVTERGHSRAAAS